MAEIKLVVVEANEIPPRIFEAFALRYPSSVIARILKEEIFGATLADDVPKEVLYPSQTWASMNTGQPFNRHEVHWYNDVKNFSDFYWYQAARNGKTTVLINTLHSSPLEEYINDGTFVAVVPDCFASTSTTVPARFSDFQELNLGVTRENGRVTTINRTIREGITSWARKPSLTNWGLSAASTLDLTRIVWSAFHINKERMRAGQFSLIAQIFLNCMETYRPDLGVLFTNHVAASLHRYWYALFPEDYRETLYSEKWINRYSGEIYWAMNLLDRWIGRILQFCVNNGYVMVLTTSMGQYANPNLTRESVGARRDSYRLREPLRMAEALFGADHGLTLEAAMVPQITFSAKSTDRARELKLRLEANASRIQGLSIVCETRQSKLTLTARVAPRQNGDDRILIGNAFHSPEQLGFLKFSIDDHHSGRHHPLGTIIAANDRKKIFRNWHGTENSYLLFAPQLKELLGNGAHV